MGLIQEFRDFAVKGNVVDLAVGIVIGAAFGKIVDSFVKNILTPLIPTGNVDFSNVTIPMPWGKSGIGIGAFVNEIIAFTIIAVALFIVVKAVNRFRKPVEAAVDLAALNSQQNAKIIELLEKIAADRKI